MPAWTAMRNLATGDLVTETDMDAIRGNIEYLFTPNSASIMLTDAGTISSTSTIWHDIHEDLEVTLTTYGGPVLLTFTASFYGVTVGNIAFFDVAVDGTLVSGCTYGITSQVAASTNVNQCESVTMTVLLTDLAAGSHVFKPQWKMNSGTTGKIQASTSYNATGFSVIEL